jgi:hypothetical protein
LGDLQLDAFGELRHHVPQPQGGVRKHIDVLLGAVKRADGSGGQLAPSVVDPDQLRSAIGDAGGLGPEDGFRDAEEVGELLAGSRPGQAANGYPAPGGLGIGANQLGDFFQALAGLADRVV